MPIPPVIPFRSIPILAALNEGDWLALTPVCQLRGYDKGTILFREGDPADRICFVVLGQVKIVKAAGGRDVILEILGVGEPVGAVAAFERRPYPATAVTLEPSSILSIPEAEFFHLLESRPEIVRRLLSGLTMRLMGLNKRLADMTGSLERRAARLFLTLNERLAGGAPSLDVPLSLSRQDLADLLATTIESAIRLMSRWQKDGVVETTGEGFRILDRKTLENLTRDE